MQRNVWLLLLLLGCLANSWLQVDGTTAATTFEYTRDAAKIVDIWVDHTVFEVLGGSKAPKLSGPAISAGILRWGKNDNSTMHSPDGELITVAAVLSTGDAKLSLSKTRYKGEDKVPSYPDVVNSNIKV
jgi:hypothetical protein